MMEDVRSKGGEGGEGIKQVWKSILGSLVTTQPTHPLEHIHNYLGELIDPQTSSRPSTSSHHHTDTTKLTTSVVDLINCIEYNSIFTEQFNDQVYAIYSHLTDDSKECLLEGIPCSIYEEFITQYTSVIDELLKEPVKIILYSHHEPCVSYSSLKEAITGIISIQEYYRLAKELYHSITMTTNLAQVIIDQLTEMTPWQQLQLNWDNLVEEKEFLKTTLQLFYQQYTQYEEDQ